MQAKYKSILLILLCLFLITGCSLFKKDDSKNNNQEEKVIELDDNTRNQKKILKEKGVELYNNNEYINYSKKNDIYFISLKELNEKYDFDISIFVGDDGTKCNLNESGIYFDIDNKFDIDLSIDGYVPVLPALFGCFKDEFDEENNN